MSPDVGPVSRILRLAALLGAQRAASLAGVGRAAYDALLEVLSESVDERDIGTKHRSHLIAALDQHGVTAANS